ncbi:MAG: PilZ domain-containing protein [Candidatus Omnitrophica bacterium]|nr:PilZ domain-containing protein [Candidatus Omnitrophota bacterium]
MSKENKNAERRVEQRFDAQLPLEIGGADFKIATATKNISPSGIYCQVDRFVPVMTKLGLNITIPLLENNKKIEKKFNCQAVVVRIQPESEIDTSNGYQLGLFFVDIKDEDKQVINHYLRHAFFAGNN